jgi:hypothetical protein
VVVAKYSLMLNIYISSGLHQLVYLSEFYGLMKH